MATKKKKKLQKVTARLYAVDIVRLKEIADEWDVPYQAVLRKLVHRALAEEKDSEALVR